VDAFLPTSTDAQPLLGFIGDTLLVLEQRIQDQQVRMTVKRYSVLRDRCSWLPIAPT
jgi:hypothetical protein